MIFATRILREVELLQQRIKNTESLMDLKLDRARNSLLSFSVLFAYLSACIAIGALVPGFFGKLLTVSHLRNGIGQVP